MKPPCEIVVKHLLPALRAMIAKELTEKYGFKQEESARKLGITQSAISYYLSGSRGARNARGYRVIALKRNPQVKAAVKEIAKATAGDGTTTVQTIQKLCKTCIILRSGEDLCKMHMETLPSIGETCNLCQLMFTR